MQCVTDLVDYYVLNNSRVIQLKSGRIVLPLCLHRTLDVKKNDWAGQLLCYLSDDQGKTWRRSKSIFEGKDTTGMRVTVQEPGVVELNDVEALVARPNALKEHLLGMSFLGRLRSYELNGDMLILRGDVAQPAAAITPTRCDGIEITVGQDERRCFKPGAGKAEHFKDCPTCPELMVVPAGSFTMGSPANEPQRFDDEVEVRVTIPAPFAVGKFAVTFDEWDVCVSEGGCNGYKPGDEGRGRGKRPVINVNWRGRCRLT